MSMQERGKRAGWEMYDSWCRYMGAWVRDGLFLGRGVKSLLSGYLDCLGCLESLVLNDW